MDEQTTERHEPEDNTPVSCLDLLFLIRAHNQGEITLKQWWEFSEA